MQLKECNRETTRRTKTGTVATATTVLVNGTGTVLYDNQSTASYGGYKYQTSRNMLCCGRRKNGKDLPDLSASPGRAPILTQNQIMSGSSVGGSGTLVNHHHQTPIVRSAGGNINNTPPAMVIQSDFRKISGISSEIFKQIESIENDHDSMTAAALEMVERRGEMIVRILEVRQLSRPSQEHAKRFMQNLQQSEQQSSGTRPFVQFVEIVKRPGQTLGLYIREGNGIDRNDGVFISRIALESAVYNSGCLRVGDEILAVNFVDVTRMSLDDVVIIMSIPRRLILVTRQRKGGLAHSGTGTMNSNMGTLGRNTMPSPSVQHKQPPVVVMKNVTASGDSNNNDGEDVLDGFRTEDRRRFKDEQNNNDLMMDLASNRTRDSLRRQQKLVTDELNKTLPRRFDRQNVMFSDEERYENLPVRYKADNWCYQQQQQQQPQQQQQNSNVITEQPKSRLQTGTATYDRTFPRTLESLAEKVHPFYATQRRPIAGNAPDQLNNNNSNFRGKIGGGPQPHRSILRSGSDQYLPKTEYMTSADESGSYNGPLLSKQSLLRSSLKSSASLQASGGTVTGPKSQQPLAYRYPGKYGLLSSTSNIPKTLLDYSSDSEAVCGGSISGSKSNLYHYKSPVGGGGGGSASTRFNSNLIGVPSVTDYTSKFSSLPKENRIKFNLNKKFGFDPSSSELNHYAVTGTDFNQFNISDEYGSKSTAAAMLMNRGGHNINSNQYQRPFGMTSSPSPSSSTNFSANEYRSWLNRTPSTSAIYEQIKANKTLLNEQRLPRYTYSAENIHSALKNSKYDLNRYRLNKPVMPTQPLRLPGSSIGVAGRSTNTLGQLLSSNSASAAGVSMNHPQPHHTNTMPAALKRIRPFLDLDSSIATGAQSGMTGATSGSLSSVSNRSLNCLNSSPVPTPSQTLSRTNSIRQVNINPADFLKYKVDKNTTGTSALSSVYGYDYLSSTTSTVPGNSNSLTKTMLMSGGISGMLWLHLLAGRGLRTSTANTTGNPAATGSVTGNVNSRDLYCVIECDRVHKARTVVRTGDMVFDWDENFELDLINNKELDLLVYSWDPQYRHKLCYKGTIHLVSLLSENPTHQLALKIEPRGTLYLRLKYVDPKEFFKRKPLPNLLVNVRLFGNDIEKIIANETKMYGNSTVANVPLLVQKCIEEVERRGLDIVGLYRLCASATKKRILREAFERNCRQVDLSPENVPDINVITGVLKDFLRELTEPLFTKCVYQMMVDALSACIANEADAGSNGSSSKLLVSLLDYLPLVNRATVVYLLDHFSTVSSLSERNKMTAQSLSTVLAPPLIMHSSTADIQIGSSLKQSTGELNYAQPIALFKYLLQIWPLHKQQKRTVMVTTGQTSNTTSATNSDCHKSIGTLGGTQNVYPRTPQQPANTISTAPAKTLVTTVASSISNSIPISTPLARTVFPVDRPKAAATTEKDYVPALSVHQTSPTISLNFPKASPTQKLSPVVNYNNSSNNSLPTSSTTINKLDTARKKSLDTIDEISNIIVASSSSSASSSSASSSSSSSSSTESSTKSSPSATNSSVIAPVSSSDNYSTAASTKSPYSPFLTTSSASYLATSTVTINNNNNNNNNHYNNNKLKPSPNNESTNNSIRLTQQNELINNKTTSTTSSSLASCTNPFITGIYKQPTIDNDFGTYMLKESGMSVGSMGSSSSGGSSSSSGLSTSNNNRVVTMGKLLFSSGSGSGMAPTKTSNSNNNDFRNNNNGRPKDDANDHHRFYGK